MKVKLRNNNMTDELEEGEIVEDGEIFEFSDISDVDLEVVEPESKSWNGSKRLEVTKIENNDIKRKCILFCIILIMKIEY